MTSGLQHQFNWEGRLGWKTKTNQCKKGFKSTRLCDIMMKTLINRKNLQTDEAEVRKLMMTYLRNAADRVFGRQRRRDHDTSSQSNDSQDLE